MRAVELLDLALAAQQKANARKYWDKTNFPTFEDQLAALQDSTTVYIGNLSYYTSEQLVYELSRQAGPIKRVIMGLHREKKTPCGFAFVEYFARASCLDAEALLNGKTLDGRLLKIELDPGFKEGRQFGRGRGGGQVRDDFRETDDPERGGVGSLASAGLLPGSNTFQQQQPILSAPVMPMIAGPVLSLDAPLPFSRPSYDNGGDRGGDSYDRRGRYSREGGGRGGGYDGRRGGGGRARSRDRGRYNNAGGGRNRPSATNNGPRVPQVDEFGRDVAPQDEKPVDTDYE